MIPNIKYNGHIFDINNIDIDSSMNINNSTLNNPLGRPRYTYVPQAVTSIQFTCLNCNLTFKFHTEMGNWLEEYLSKTLGNNYNVMALQLLELIQSKPSCAEVKFEGLLA